MKLNKCNFIQVTKRGKSTESRVSFPYFFQGRADQAGQGAEGDQGGQGAEAGITEWRLLLFLGSRHQSQAQQVSSWMMKRKIQKHRIFREHHLAQSPHLCLLLLPTPSCGRPLFKPARSTHALQTWLCDLKYEIFGTSFLKMFFFKSIPTSWLEM